MSNGEIDRIPVNQLSGRYTLARSAVYTRMDALEIRPRRIGNKAYITGDELRLLDELHAFIQNGGTNAEFREMKGIQGNPQVPVEESSGLSTLQPDFARLVAAIAAEIASRFQPPVAEPDPYAYLEVLEKAYHNGWLLSTSEVADLLDLLPAEIRQYGDSFTEAGFVFTKAGYRAGGEVAWRVSKAVK